MKSYMSKIGASCLTALMFASSFSGVVAQDQDTRLDRYRGSREWRKQQVPPGEWYTGRSPFNWLQGRIQQPEPAPAPAPRVLEVPAAAPAPAASCAVVNTELTHMTKTMPAEVTLGQEFMYTIRATAKDCIADVVITDMVPEGAQYVRSEPAASVAGDKLTWTMAEMDPGASAEIKVWVKAMKEGTLASCATIHAVPRVCASTFVGKPALQISKTGPETALLGSDVTYNIVVKNTGTSVAKSVVVTDNVPAGLTHSTGQNVLSFNVGDLAPNQSRSIPVTFKATQRGKVCNPAVAKSSNAGEVNDQACTTIVERGLDITKVGPKEAILKKTAGYDIVVTNTGDTPLTGVVVSDTAPVQTSIVSADGASVTGNTAVWNVGTLNAGEKKSFKVVLTSSIAGTHCNGAAVRSNEGLTKSADACTLWKGVSALLIEVVDDPDPIQKGEKVTYTIRVTNQGTIEDTNIEVTAAFPAQVKPLSSPQGTVTGNNVSFPAYPRLAPKASFVYTITAEGAEVGIGIVTVKRRSTDIPVWVTEEESTRTY